MACQEMGDKYWALHDPVISCMHCLCGQGCTVSSRVCGAQSACDFLSTLRTYVWLRFLACDWCDLCRLVFWRGQWDLVEHFRTLPWNFSKFRQGILWSMWCGALSADLESSETRCSCNLAEHFALRRYGERKRFQNRIESDRKIRKDTNSIE